MPAPISDQKRRGAWYTPPALVDRVVEAVVDRDFVDARSGRTIEVLDPACGDGRFLAAVAKRIGDLGGTCSVTGIDIDEGAVASAQAALPDGSDVLCADALSFDRGSIGPESGFDLVIGNPPFLSQMAASTTRGSASRHGGGPYADAAVEFLSLGAAAVDADGGRLALVLPQSLLSARDAGPVRAAVDEKATMIWSTWSGDREFDAQVHTCVVAFEFGRPEPRPATTWSHVITDRSGVPPLPSVLDTSTRLMYSRLGDRAWLNANFRDEYYGMVPAVGDHDAGPKLVTSGLIDPGVNLWGERSIRFAKQRFERPRLDLDRLDATMRRWADKRLVPKVLVANQTPIIEAVCDPDGDCLPGVPVVSVYPHGDRSEAAATAWEIAAMLTSPSVSAWAWHQRAGTGLSSNTIRVGPTMLAELPWPDDDLSDSVSALRDGDVERCGRSVDAAYGIDAAEADRLAAWWLPILDRIRSRR